MIASTDDHVDDGTLTSLLDETLPDPQADRVQSHLSGCEKCRQSLQRLAGDESWWNETVDTLSTQQPAAMTVDWLMPLLQPPDEHHGVHQGLGKLDRYCVSSVIGQGGMGVVLHATEPELNRPVALKVLAPHLAGVGAARARFMREAQAAAAVVHPSIVPIYSVVATARLPYLVMPLVEGGNLQQRIDAEGPLELADVLRIGAEVAEGLAAAHHQGVIHRDIKPANLLVEAGNGRTLISDFGLARALNDASLTCSGMIAGTPQYMSPEQARGEPLDPRSDLFSLGSVLYALATARPPFRADNPLAVLKKITESRVRPIHEINECMPAWLDELVYQLMAINADDRIGSAQEAATLLRQAHAHVRHPAAEPLPASLTNNRAEKPIPKFLRYAVITAATVLVLIGGWFWLESSSLGPRIHSLLEKRDRSDVTTRPSNITPSQQPFPYQLSPQSLGDQYLSLDNASTQNVRAGSYVSTAFPAGLPGDLQSIDGELFLLEQQLGIAGGQTRPIVSMAAEAVDGDRFTTRPSSVQHTSEPTSDRTRLSIPELLREKR
ncbi:Serine/threonine-protein kinase PknB [Rubripirellula lacrimiformis]|uniref:Serine/threonine-protein kinase PknB n=1 Tax=Rubripirellula lacrimiformis TaxID=1930273 RepID=A0A517NDP1_9BACT|nr:serine/threonine-protein kinase [Rubripirellula lacrimiformis]QDT05245.1 Serine/threonine-protein kinase PknB [Rubripirellula lacrimiformis]